MTHMANTATRSDQHVSGSGASSGIVNIGPSYTDSGTYLRSVRVPADTSPSVTAVDHSARELQNAAIERCRTLGRIPLQFLRWHPEIALVAGVGVMPRTLLAFKRGVDLFISLLIGLLVLPIIPLVMMAIKLDSTGPVLYSQARLGQHGRIFRIYKFRSMITDAEAAGAQFAGKNDTRVTRVGRFMRRTRIDELPQLWNVIRGDMSFIGPRPERPDHMGKILADIPEFKLRLQVKPGLTGWAQTKYRYAATVDELRAKLEYDLYYMRFASIRMELVILVRTIKVVLGSKGQ